MSTSGTRAARALAAEVGFSDEMLRVRLSDGRELSVPLEWFPALRDASPEQRTYCQLIGGGVGIHWPDLDEDISVEGLLGNPALRGRTSVRRPAARFFVKGGLVHRYPLPPACGVHFDDEELYSAPPAAREKCDPCFPLPR